MAQADLPIGIAFGTNYSCVAVWQGDHAEVIANEQGNRSTPCCVPAAFLKVEEIPPPQGTGVGGFVQHNSSFASLQLTLEITPHLVPIGCLSIFSISVFSSSSKKGLLTSFEKGK